MPWSPRDVPPKVGWGVARRSRCQEDGVANPRSELLTSEQRSPTGEVKQTFVSVKPTWTHSHTWGAACTAVPPPRSLGVYPRAREEGGACAYERRLTRVGRAKRAGKHMKRLPRRRKKGMLWGRRHMDTRGYKLRCCLPPVFPSRAVSVGGG